MAPSASSVQRWWKEAVVYQIYPSSFNDSNGDGWGDIKGITAKVDYLKELGVDILWCSPMYKSPQADMGYDIADYKAIDPRYGSLADMDELIAELKKREMKMMMDLVVNHTSDQHAWFLESRKSRDNPKRDWYIWKPPRGYSPSGTPLPPNNWQQILGVANSAWTFAPETGEFFLSLFTPEQPDLNWEKDAVRAAVHDVMEFWIERGACGFRMDVINLISKNQAFPDAEVNMPAGFEYQDGSAFYANGPRMHEFHREMYDKVLSKHDSITVGEMPFNHSEQEVLRSVAAGTKELNMIFIFDLVDIDTVPGQTKFTLQPFDARDIARIQSKWQEAMARADGWNALFTTNHDQPRSVSRYADDSDEWRVKGAKLVILMQSTLAGTLYLYQGDELGMRNLPGTCDVETDYKDVESRNFWRATEKLYGPGAPGGGCAEKVVEAREILRRKARDHTRAVMQWDGSANGGFCAEGVRPWMRVNDDHETVNAKSQVESAGAGAGGDDDGGMTVWYFYQRALAERKRNKDVFVYGGYEQVGGECAPEQVFAYVRTAKGDVEGVGVGRRWLVVLNFSGRHVRWTVPAGCEVNTWLAGNYAPGRVEKEGKGEVQLGPWEGVLGVCER